MADPAQIEKALANARQKGDKDAVAVLEAMRPPGGGSSSKSALAPFAAAVGERPILTDVGTFIPRVRSRPRLTCMTATSIITSLFGLSRSASSFSASIIWSGVPRRIRAS